MEVFKKYLEEKAQVTNEQFRHLEKLAGEKKIAKGEYLLRQEEVCDKIYFVEKGLLRAEVKNTSTSLPQKIGLLPTGAVYFLIYLQNILLMHWKKVN